MPYAISLAEENGAKLILLHVEKDPGEDKRNPQEKESAAEILRQLDGLVPSQVGQYRPIPSCSVGQPAEAILEAAKERQADLIVLGVRGARHMLVATHLKEVQPTRLLPELTARCLR